MSSCGRLLSILIIALVLSACAHSPASSVNLTQPELPDHWQVGHAIAISDLPDFQKLVALDDSIKEEFRQDRILTATADERIRYLMEHLLGSSQQPFLYRSNRTTPASVTYRSHAGNCLSLTLLAYAMAESLGFHADIQEVMTPQVWERRSSIDFINRHVNVRLSHPAHGLQNGIDFSRDIILDFEPSDNVSRFRHRTLEQSEIVAMYFNNLGAEALVHGDLQHAFSFFRAATQVYNQFESPWINLALLYQRVGDVQTAETALRYARHLSAENESALRALYELMVKLERPEAVTLLAEIRQRERHDPYYLLRKAKAAMAEEEWGEARDLLLAAEKLAHGFPEIHQSLAKSYAMLGQPELANAQVELAASLLADQANAAVYVPVVVTERPAAAETVTK